jgi:hypothetical protein
MGTGSFLENEHFFTNAYGASDQTMLPAARLSLVENALPTFSGGGLLRLRAQQSGNEP